MQKRQEDRHKHAPMQKFSSLGSGLKSIYSNLHILSPLPTSHLHTVGLCDGTPHTGAQRWRPPYPLLLATTPFLSDGFPFCNSPAESEIIVWTPLCRQLTDTNPVRWAAASTSTTAESRAGAGDPQRLTAQRNPWRKNTQRSRHKERLPRGNHMKSIWTWDTFPKLSCSHTGTKAAKPQALPAPVAAAQPQDSRQMTAKTVKDGR